MAAQPGPHVIEQIRLILGPDGTVTPKAVSPTFYQELDAEFDQFRGHTLIQTPGEGTLNVETPG